MYGKVYFLKYSDLWRRYVCGKEYAIKVSETGHIFVTGEVKMTSDDGDFNGTLLVGKLFKDPRVIIWIVNINNNV